MWHCPSKTWQLMKYQAAKYSAFSSVSISKNIHFSLEELCHWSSDMKMILASRFCVINLKFNG